jgi:hypothetical protein
MFALMVGAAKYMPDIFERLLIVSQSLQRAYVQAQLLIQDHDLDQALHVLPLVATR